jgi:hypothetical protein
MDSQAAVDFWLVSYRDHPKGSDDTSPNKIYGRIIRELPAALAQPGFYHRRSAVYDRLHTIGYVGAEGTEKEPRAESYLNSFHVLP